MESHTAISGHLLLLCAPEWGHARPLCVFACKVVKEHPDIAITILTAGPFYPRMNGEISRYFSASDADLKVKPNIRLVHIGERGPDAFTSMPLLVEQFTVYYDKLINSQPVQCLKTRITFDAVLKPTAVVLDVGGFVCAGPPLGDFIPVFAWGIAYAASTLRILASEKYGGVGDVGTKARIEVEATGRNMEEVIDEMYLLTKGEVVNVPGMPPMYDYEWVSQEPTPGVPQNVMFAAAHTFACECDGFVSVSSPAFEQKSLEAMRAWLAETNRPVYAIGPLMPPGIGGSGLSETAKQMEIDSSNKGGEFQAFLDKTLKSHGTRSLIYISFGSFWWPKRNEHVWILVDALLELNFPFVLSHASPHAVIPPGYLEKINQSGIGLLSTWSPQQAILNHPATGWFLTHCGQNSITEALVSGIPIIAWPIAADQPVNAAYIALSLDVAFEMVEVRTGPGLQPLYRGARPSGTVETVAAEVRSILQKARGSDGERKRRNAESLRDKWRGEWEEDGDALKNLRQFLADFCDTQRKLR